ncbi:MAG TPA: hypothetical protein VFI06_17615 [Chitinophagaceae bacterium]|nr:hypothetical protein [Chitinophagaceae bacterium]
MSKEQTKDLLKFLKPFDKEIIELVMWLRDFAWDICPEANELIYDNYNAVAFGRSPTEKLGHTICSIAVGRSSSNVHFGFYWGNELPDPDKILLGEGNQYRYILVTDRKKFPKAYIKKLVNQAHANSLSKVKDPREIVHGKTIVKSVSEKKRPGKGAAGKQKK